MLNINNIKYAGSGNGYMGNLAKVKVIGEDPDNSGFFIVEIIEVYATLWGEGVPNPGRTTLELERFLFDTYEEAFKSWKIQMRFKNNHKVIEYVFTIYP
jgi:hypothetical protein